MTRVLAFSVVFLATVAAAEIPLANPAIAPSTVIQYRPDPAVTLGGSTILVAWEERSMAAWANSAQTVIRTFTPSGQPLQRAFVSLGYRYAPKAVWNGSEYFIVFSSYISRFGSISPIPAMEGVRVREDGSVVDGSRVTLAKSTHSISAAAVVWNGSEYLVAATDQLVVVAPDGKVISTTPHGGSRPAGAVPFADGFYVLSTSQSGVVAERVSAAGAIVESHPLSQDAFIFGGAIARNGSTVAAVWSKEDAIYASFIDGQSTMGPIQITPATSAQLSSLAWDGSAWITTWQSAGSLCRARILPGSTPVTVCDRIQPGNSAQPVMTSDASKTALVWIEGLLLPGTDRTDVVKLSIDSAGHLPEPQRGQTISLSAQPLSQPAVAPDGSGGLIAGWSEWNALSRQTEVHLGGLAADGSVRPDLMISMNASSPRIARGRSTSLMVWTDARLTPSYIEGVGIDGSGNAVGPWLSFGAGTAPHVAWDGKEWLVVWQSVQEADGTSQILTATVAENGDVDWPPHAPIEANGALQSSPSVDWSGQGFVVTWLEHSANESTARLVTRLVDAKGMAIGGRTVISPPEQSALYWMPTTTTCGSTCLVTWVRTDTSYVGATVQTDASPASSPFTITPNVGLPWQSEPSVIATGNTFSLYVPAFGPTAQIVVDAMGNVLSRRRVAPDSAGGIAATLVGSTPWIVYGRTTAPDELYGGATVIFAAPVGPFRRRTAEP